jgi:hypothetical protein
MGVSGGPFSNKDGLILSIDSASQTRGFSKYGTGGVNNSYRSIRSLSPDKTLYDISTTSYLSNVNYYTLYGITYPESSYSPASRDGITAGFDNISSGKLYSASRDLNYYVFDEDTETWVSDSYFNGERVGGHCYDTYDGQPNQHVTFQTDFDNIVRAFPNATHIVIGSHAAENNVANDETRNRLVSIGLPNDHSSGVRWEYILVGKVGKPWTHHYVRENINSAVAHMNLALPLERPMGNLTFNGVDDYINIGSFNLLSMAGSTLEAIIFMNNLSGPDNSYSIFGGLSNEGYHGYHEIRNTGSGWKMTYWTSANGWRYANTNLSENRWYHVTWVWEGLTLKFYLNGVSDGSYTFSTFSPYGLGVSKIGYFPNERYMNGSIPVAKIYNRSLSADEVNKNYRSYKSRFGI